ncbi:MAG TPA: hypothetical protein VMU34_02665 [Mycobacterium sp.]|nr:hypothetical protein [Mycobacterium sp.]
MTTTQHPWWAHLLVAATIAVAGMIVATMLSAPAHAEPVQATCERFGGHYIQLSNAIEACCWWTPETWGDKSKCNYYVNGNIVSSPGGGQPPPTTPHPVPPGSLPSPPPAQP